MTENIMLTTPPPIVKRGGKFIVLLKSCGNPDYGQDPDRKMPGVPNYFAHVQTMEEASALCRHYITYYDLGGGNWAGGELLTPDKTPIGVFSYNGTFHKYESLAHLKGAKR